MNTRELGRTGIRVSEIGLGTWELSGEWGQKDDSMSLEAIRVGVDFGVTFIDTAAIYGYGRGEELVGRFLHTTSTPRDFIVLSTKVAPKSREFAPPPERPISDAFPLGWIRSQCDESLQRLKTSYVDVLFLHTWSRSWAHELSWYEELKDLKEEGKIRAFGISIPDEGITDANVAIALGMVDVIQCVYSPFQQEPEYSLFPLADVHGGRYRGQEPL